jgi:hypothetical protein
MFRKASLLISAIVLVAGIDFNLDSVAIHGGAEYGYQPGMPSSPTMTAVGLLGRQFLGAKHDSTMLTGGEKYLMNHLPDDKLSNVYYWYFGTQVMHNMSGEAWDTWHRKMRSVLIETQIRGDTCANGSWDPAKDAWGKQGGRVMATSLSALSLEVNYGLLPIFKNSERNGADAAKPSGAAKGKKAADPDDEDPFGRN